MIRTMGCSSMKRIRLEGLAAGVVIGCCLLGLPARVEASKDNLPRMPGAVLLVGHFPDGLAVTGDDTTTIEGSGGWEVLPSLSADGRMVASARMVQGRAMDLEPTFLVGTYRVADGEWKEYPELEIMGGTVAISPDGTKVACSKMAEGEALLHILDLKTGKIWVGPESTKGAGFLTWSPDSRRIAFNREVPQASDGSLSALFPEIDVLTLADGRVAKIADGTAPSWSPSGEWIAFSDYSVFRHGKYADTAFRVSLIHPDGTGSVELLRQSKDLLLPAIWSPDSKELMLQGSPDDTVNPRVNIYLLDVATLKMTEKFKRMPEIYGWAVAK
jgi:hypothetical protein